MPIRSTADLERTALRLNRRQRARVALTLLESLEKPDGSPAEVENAWAEEADRRDREIEEGDVRSLPAAEAFASVSRKRRA